MYFEDEFGMPEKDLRAIGTRLTEKIREVGSEEFNMLLPAGLPGLSPQEMIYEMANLTKTGIELITLNQSLVHDFDEEADDSADLQRAG